jgi:hypothetical protein
MEHLDDTRSRTTPVLRGNRVSQELAQLSLEDSANPLPKNARSLRADNSGSFLDKSVIF